MSADFSKHPCFSPEAHHRYARVHLPVAPDCNIGCNFCNRKNDCLNESRPGVTSTLLSPHQSIAYLEHITDVLDAPVSVVGIAGPGDPFATPDTTMETLRLVRKRYPDMLLCLASNGLGITPYAKELGELAVGHVTITVNAVDPHVGARIYRFVRPDKTVYRGEEGAQLLLDRQLAAIRALKANGVTVKINTIVIPTVNVGHVEEVARTVAGLGADVHNCIPLYPVKDTPFEHLSEPSIPAMEMLRARCVGYMPQMTHCSRCRADAAGILGQDNAELVQAALSQAASLPLRPTENRPYVAVASLEGVLVNQHLGEAETLWIFERTAAGELEHVDTRPAPQPGGGDERWTSLADRLPDCRALLCAAAGQRPKVILAAKGIRLLVADGLIEEAMEAVYAGHKPRMPARVLDRGSDCDADGVGCGSCAGPGTGCG
ncbi:MAG: radical SAM protein [Tepidisphaerales bacterium]